MKMKSFFYYIIEVKNFLEDQLVGSSLVLFSNMESECL